MDTFILGLICIALYFEIFILIIIIFVGCLGWGCGEEGRSVLKYYPEDDSKKNT